MLEIDKSKVDFLVTAGMVQEVKDILSRDLPQVKKIVDEIALYPAKSGAQVTLQIAFTAPFEQGVYESAWQAFDPNGLPFGDAVYIRILVSP